jgi:antitoxin VapB
MNLQIRDPKARALAKELADKKGLTMSEAVVQALEAELKRERRRRLPDQLRELADELAALSTGSGRDMTKDEIDAMWGHD